MPELPEVETTRRGVAPLLTGRAVVATEVREPRLRWPVELPRELIGQSLTAVGRRAKYLIFSFESGHLLLHLGMSGSLRVVPARMPYLKHDHVAIEFDDGRALRLNDPRRFGSVHWHVRAPDTHWLLSGLGIEPLDPAFDGKYLKDRARRRRLAVKNFIMDSRIVVGVGNIYANEALFLARIRPTVAAGRVTRAGYGELAARIRLVLASAIQMGGTTLRDFVNQDGNPGYFKQSLNVYDRAGLPCPVCGTALTGIRLGQRSTVFCRKCQRAQGFTASAC
jgi:formamidopyrimidine-DNA glycosylase